MSESKGAGGDAHGLEIPSETKKAIRAAKIKHKHAFLIMEINEESLSVLPSKFGDKSASFDDLVKALPTKASRYCLFEHSFTTPDGRLTSKAYFIIWNPRRAGAHSKMLYTTHKASVQSAIGGISMVAADSVDDLRRVLKIPAKPDSDSDSSDDDY